MIGAVEHVLEVPELDVFDGIVLTTPGGLRFADADQLADITDRYVMLNLPVEETTSQQFLLCPKGKLHLGETEAQAALREVQEETGLRCRLGRDVGTSAYRDPKRRPKTVRYWEMTPTAGTLGPANEIDDARWVPLQETPMLLTYQHDRRLLEGWHPAG